MKKSIQGWSAASGKLFGGGLYLGGRGAHLIGRMTDDMVVRITRACG